MAVNEPCETKLVQANQDQCNRKNLHQTFQLHTSEGLQIFLVPIFSGGKDNGLMLKKMQKMTIVKCTPTTLKINYLRRYFFGKFSIFWNF